MSDTPLEFGDPSDLEHLRGEFRGWLAEHPLPERGADEQAEEAVGCVHVHVHVHVHVREVRIVAYELHSVAVLDWCQIGTYGARACP